MKKIILALCVFIHIIIVAAAAAAAAAAVPVLRVRIVIMSDLCSRCGHYIFILSFFFSRHYIFALLFLLSSFFPRLISAVADWGLPYFHTWCGLTANLGCRSETCCTRLAENTVRKKVAKIVIWTPLHKFVGLYLRN